MKMNKIGSNMTEVESNGYTVLFSYETPVACHSTEEMKFFRTSKKWSNTTTRHINKFMKRHGDPRQVVERDQEWFDGLLD